MRAFGISALASTAAVVLMTAGVAHAQPPIVIERAQPCGPTLDFTDKDVVIAVSGSTRRAATAPSA